MEAKPGTFLDYHYNHFSRWAKTIRREQGYQSELTAFLDKLAKEVEKGNIRRKNDGKSNRRLHYGDKVIA